eukprot:GILI01005794.1.p1 GENE.GILI01005794.1~~GILI01005794.1.p1  ORF type:complete len:391 (-),score=146.35 GILI01005794.1:163-1335(-)
MRSPAIAFCLLALVATVLPSVAGSADVDGCATCKQVMSRLLPAMGGSNDEESLLMNSVNAVKAYLEDEPQRRNEVALLLQSISEKKTTYSSISEGDFLECGNGPFICQLFGDQVCPAQKGQSDSYLGKAKISYAFLEFLRPRLNFIKTIDDLKAEAAKGLARCLESWDPCSRMACKVLFQEVALMYYPDPDSLIQHSKLAQDNIESEGIDPSSVEHSDEKEMEEKIKKELAEHEDRDSAESEEVLEKKQAKIEKAFNANSMADWLSTKYETNTWEEEVGTIDNTPVPTGVTYKFDERNWAALVEEFSQPFSPEVAREAAEDEVKLRAQFSGDAGDAPAPREIEVEDEETSAKKSKKSKDSNEDEEEEESRKESKKESEEESDGDSFLQKN